MKRHDYCPKCHKPKDVRAKQCSVCRRQEWKLSKLATRARRYNNCQCGAVKDKRAKLCNICRKGIDHTRRLDRSKCPKCGRKKGEKSLHCRNCRLKEISPIKAGLITCTACLMPKRLNYYHIWRVNGGIRYKPCCKRCTSMMERKRHIVRRCRKLKLPDSEILRLVMLSGVACEICGTFIKQFHMDHCHRTNKFRGFLCSNCNTGIGLLNDDPIRLRLAVDYLERFQQRLVDLSHGEPA